MSSLRHLITLAVIASTIGLAACEGTGSNSLNNSHLSVERSRPDGR